jgi:hypothetical protein
MKKCWIFFSLFRHLTWFQRESGCYESLAECLWPADTLCSAGNPPGTTNACSAWQHNLHLCCWWWLNSKGCWYPWYRSPGSCSIWRPHHWSPSPPWSDHPWYCIWRESKDDVFFLFHQFFLNLTSQSGLWWEFCGTLWLKIYIKFHSLFFWVREGTLLLVISRPGWRCWL